MTHDLAFQITTTRFDENYVPAQHSRITTNFANLARGEHRQQNLSNALNMMNNRFNGLVHWDNPQNDRYTLELDIVSVALEQDSISAQTADDETGTAGSAEAIPLIEVLRITIVDQHTGRHIPGIIGNNLSSYIRDYDFSVLLPEHLANNAPGTEPQDFGKLHGELFEAFIGSAAYAQLTTKAPVVCISVSSKTSYRRLDNTHPILGAEYQQDELSLTDRYFAEMGLHVRFFMPPGSTAPLAFYSRSDLLNDYSNLELSGSISVMETFQKIYRPEIYNANTAAGSIYKANLSQPDFSRTQITYDREERAVLGAQQGKLTEKLLLQPVREALTRASTSAPVSPSAATELASTLV